jgi:hypothetical protein
MSACSKLCRRRQNFRLARKPTTTGNIAHVNKYPWRRLAPEQAL